LTLAASSVYPVPALSIDRSLNVATPLTAVWVTVPLSVPVSCSSVSLIWLVLSVVMTLPSVSSTLTTIGASVCPALPLTGSVVNTSLFGCADHASCSGTKMPTQTPATMSATSAILLLNMMFTPSQDTYGSNGCSSPWTNHP
jgi:hypothetical protein